MSAVSSPFAGPVVVSLLWAMAATAACAGAWAFSTWFSRRHTGAVRHWAHEDLGDLFLFIDPATAARFSAVALLAVPLLGLSAGAPVWIIVLTCIGWLWLPRMVSSQLRGLRRRRLELQLPDAADALAAALRGGAGLSQAVAMLIEHQRSPLRDEFSLVVRQQRLGLPMDEALLQLAARNGSRDVELFSATLRVARELGGGLADALQRLAAGLRRRRAIEDKIDALTSQGRTQGVIVSLLPLLLAMALLLLEPRATRPLFTTPPGWATLAVVGGLQIVGWLLIRRIVRIEV